MKALTTQAFTDGAFDRLGWRERLAERGRPAGQTLRRAGTVMAVFVLGGALHAMRWAAVLGLY